MKAYVFLADGFEEVEAITIVDLLRRAEIEVNMVSITSNINVKGSHGIVIVSDVLFGKKDFADADILILPGGMPGTKHLMEHAGLDLILQRANKNGVFIGAICAAPSVLGVKGILKNKRAVSYPGFEKELIGANVEDKAVVVDGNIITSKALGTAIDFSLTIIKTFKGEKLASEIAKSIHYDYWTNE